MLTPSRLRLEGQPHPYCPLPGGPMAGVGHLTLASSFVLSGGFAQEGTARVRGAALRQLSSLRPTTCCASPLRDLRDKKTPAESPPCLWNTSGCLKELSSAARKWPGGQQEVS